MTGLALVLPQLTPEFGISVTSVRYTTMFTFIGLSIGSTFWGVASDIWGRKPAFNITLFLCGLFGASVSLGPNWITTSALFACMGIGVGGNLPVDGALFLEFLPFESNKLLTLLSVWWPVGQLVASMLAWYLIPSWSCDTELSPCTEEGMQHCCASSDNRGWRVYIATLGGITLLMFVCRFFLFHLWESPKYLLSRNRQSEAVSVVQSIARYNGTNTWLSEELLDEFGDGVDDGAPKLTLMELNKRRFSKFSIDKIGALFADRRIGLTTILLWFMWAAIGTTPTRSAPNPSS
jgi:MFS family permease